MAGRAPAPTEALDASIRMVGRKEMLADWPLVEPLLQRVLSRIDSGHTVDDVVTKIQYGDMQLWQINKWQALVVTQITVMPQHKVLSVVYIAGQGISEWLAGLTAVMQDYARHQQCKYVEAYGRDGWRKPTKALGFKTTFSVMRLTV